jgi:hypothetical protein
MPMIAGAKPALGIVAAPVTDRSAVLGCTMVASRSPLHGHNGGMKEEASCAKICRVAIISPTTSRPACRAPGFVPLRASPDQHEAGARAIATDDAIPAGCCRGSA